MEEVGSRVDPRLESCKVGRSEVWKDGRKLETLARVIEEMIHGFRLKKWSQGDLIDWKWTNQGTRDVDKMGDKVRGQGCLGKRSALNYKCYCYLYFSPEVISLFMYALQGFGYFILSDFLFCFVTKIILNVNESLIVLSGCLWVLLWMTCVVVTSERYTSPSFTDCPQVTSVWKMDTMELKHVSDYLSLFVSIWRTGSQFVQLDF